MFLRPRSHDRPFHLGLYPLETLARDAALIDTEAARPARAAPAASPGEGLLGAALVRYRDLFAQQAEADPAPARAPVPDDLARRVVDLKGAALFMDASMVGICRIPESAWLSGVAQRPHAFAVVILVEHGRVPEAGNLAAAWAVPNQRAAAELRAGEIAVCIAGHVRNMGFAASADVPGHARLDAGRLAVLAGLAVRVGDALENPYVGARFSLAVVSTEYALECDLPLAAAALREAKGFAFWWGQAGARSGREWNRRAGRASHLGSYPMETVRRVERPTTLILDDEVPRVPKRAAFFDRALQGDLGEKAQKERARFSFKTPLSLSQLRMIRSMVPLQDGAVAGARDARFSDPAANARAIKSLSYFLGADLTGICEVPRYAWFSHRESGAPIEPYHRYAIVMLIDQGYETMEGASGDDWVSGAQSMRGYLRGAEIAGVMGELLRGEGFPARAQTNADSDVLQIPLVLWAGLGELSRIGELVLNPFVGPRFKSVVLTTDLPLEVDRPVDFGLQTFCNNCWKCARECPCDAIPFGDKVMFNGYEMWKPDVERCTRYRLTNMKGAACGRCMKTCPLNKVVDADGALGTRAASWLGLHAMWMKPLLVPIARTLDDWLGNGARNPVKKWWFDHEVVDGVAVQAKATNRRDIDPARKFDAKTQRIAYYPASRMPAPDAKGPVPLERKPALAIGAELETPAQARKRAAAGGAPPGHYTPTPTLGAAGAEARVDGPYKA